MGVSGSSGGKQALPFINVTPLIDALLMFLIVFMSACGNSAQANRTLIPEPQQATQQQQQQKPEVNASSSLVLKVEVTKNSKLLLNGKERDPQTGVPYGSVNNPDGLRVSLAKILQERDAHPGPNVYKLGTTIVEKTVYVKAPESLKYGEAVKVIDTVKAAGADPVGLQVDGLDSNDNLPQEKPNGNDPTTKPHIDVPKEAPSAKDAQPISPVSSLVISIPSDGEFYLGKVRYNIDLKAQNDPEKKRLMGDLKKEVEKRPDEERIVYIKASINVSYGQVVGIIDIIRDPEAGGVTQIGLVADRKKTTDNKVPK